MKKKQLLQLLILLILILIVVGLAMHSDRRNRWAAASARIGESVLPGMPIADIRRLEIRRGEEVLELAQGETGWGIVQRFGFPVNFERLFNLMRDLADLKAGQNVNAPDKQHLAHLELLDPLADDADSQSQGTGTLLLLYTDSDKPAARLIFGKQHLRRGGDGSNPMFADRDWPIGRYLRNPDTKKNVLVNKTLGTVTTNPASWLRKDFIKVENLKQASLHDADDRQQWSVSRTEPDAALELEGLTANEKVKDTELSSISSTLRWISFVDVADPAAAPAQTGMDSPQLLEVEDFDGLRYNFKIGALDPENRYHVQIEIAPLEAGATTAEAAATDTEDDEDKTPAQKAAEFRKLVSGWTFLINQAMLDPMLRERSALVEPKSDPAEETQTAGETAED